MIPENIVVIGTRIPCDEPNVVCVMADRGQERETPPVEVPDEDEDEPEDDGQ